MTIDLINTWLGKFLLDNAAGHKFDIKQTNIRVEFLPPNTTSVLQPMCAGIIISFKCSYKNDLINFFLKSIEEHKNITMPDIRDAIYMTKNAWSKVTSSIKIKYFIANESLFRNKKRKSEQFFS